jgi:hypothetical protein
MKKFDISTNKHNMFIRNFQYAMTNLAIVDDVTRIDGTDCRIAKIPLMSVAVSALKNICTVDTVPYNISGAYCKQVSPYK